VDQRDRVLDGVQISFEEGEHVPAHCKVHGLYAYCSLRSMHRDYSLVDIGVTADCCRRSLNILYFCSPVYILFATKVYKICIKTKSRKVLGNATHMSVNVGLVLVFLLQAHPI